MKGNGEKLTVIFLLFAAVALAAESDDDGSTATKIDMDAALREAYRKMFQSNRVQQQQAVQFLSTMNDVEKQTKTVDMLLMKLFQVLLESKAEITSSGYIPGASPFPSDTRVREALSKILENTAFFGDLLLRMPSLIGERFKKNNEWHVLFRWSWDFCTETRLIDEETGKLFDLVGQELEFIPRKANYVNPFRGNEAKLRAAAAAAAEAAKKEKEKPKRRKLPRGPSLGGRKTEL